LGQALIVSLLLGSAGNASAWENFDEDPVGQPYPGFGVPGFAGNIQWAVNGASSNWINPEQDHSDHYFVGHYSGSGWWTLTGLTGQSGRLVSSIDIWDDGTQDMGILFSVDDGDGHWAGIGINNNVVNGKYYFRTDAVAGNNGTTIPAPRTAPFGAAGWHRFQIHSDQNGAYPEVDGIRISDTFLYPALKSVSTVQITANWGKPAYSVAIDNLQVSSDAGGGGLIPGKVDDCTAITGVISYDRDSLAGYYAYNASTTNWTQISCPMTPPANHAYPDTQFVSPYEWWVNDGRSTSTDASVYWQDFSVEGTYLRTSDYASTGTFTLSFRDSSNVYVHIQDPVRRKVAITDKSAAAMVGWLPPVTNGKRSKLYSYYFNTTSG
jgi:hypothetical protein